jgi:hypothetical protein
MRAGECRAVKWGGGHPAWLVGEARRSPTVVSLPGRRAAGGWAARRAGLEESREKSPSALTSTDTTGRDAGMLLLLHPRPDRRITRSMFLTMPASTRFAEPDRRRPSWGSSSVTGAD